MLCPSCGKESKNLRVCPFCQLPYPTDGSGQAGATRRARADASAASKGTTTGGRGGDQAHGGRRSRQILWGAVGVLIVSTVAYVFVGRERAIPVGIAIPNVITRPMSPVEANSVLGSVNRTAQVEVRDGELTVRVGAAMFPQRREGQLALAQQYARADEIVQGKKRAINFLDPDGKGFARADPGKGVVLTR